MGFVPVILPFLPQSVSPGCIHSMLLLAEKELVSHREKLSGVQVSLSLSPGLGWLGVIPCPRQPYKPCALQVETLTSLKALGRHIDSSQLPPELDGAFPYCHSEWVQFFQVSVTTP